MNNRLAILAAIILGVVAALAVHFHVKSLERERIKQFEMTEIITAKRLLKAGDEVKMNFGPEGILQLQSIPVNSIVTGMISRDEIRRFNGYIVRDRIEPGEPILRDKLTPPYENAETQMSVVGPGMRALTLSVDVISGVAGLLRPSDRVDVLGTFRLKDNTTKTVYLLQNARIISLDNRTQAVSREGRSSNRNYRTVTLEVPPFDAVRLANAQEQGQIRLLLRNRGDVELQTQAVHKKEGKDMPVGFDIVTNELPQVAPHTELGPELE